MISFKDKNYNSKHKETVDIFDDSYKKSPELSEKKKEKIMKHYTDGNLTSHVCFDDQYVNIKLIYLENKSN